MAVPSVLKSRISCRADEIRVWDRRSGMQKERQRDGRLVSHPDSDAHSSALVQHCAMLQPTSQGSFMTLARLARAVGKPLERQPSVAFSFSSLSSYDVLTHACTSSFSSSSSSSALHIDPLFGLLFRLAYVGSLSIASFPFFFSYFPFPRISPPVFFFEILRWMPSPLFCSPLVP